MIMITVTTFVLQLVTAYLSVGEVCGADAIGSVQLTGPDNGICQFLGLEKNCNANYVLQAKLYDDGSVDGKLSDVFKLFDKNTILVQADVDCMNFLFIDGEKYVVVGAVFTKGAKLDDIFPERHPIVGRRFYTVVKEDVGGVVFYSSNVFTDQTCDDITEDEVKASTYLEYVGGQANIVFPSDPVNCGDIDGKKDCLKSNKCEWDTNEEICVSKDGGIVTVPGGLIGSESSQEEAPAEVPENNASNSNQLAVIGSVKLTGSDNGICQALGSKNGCEANSNLLAKLYDDGSVVGKLTDVSNFGDKNIILVQADVDCMNFFFIGGNKYVVVGGVYTKGDKLVDIFELDTPFVGRRFITVAKEDTDGVVFYSDNFVLLTDTCDDITKDDVETRDYYENVGRKATIVFPSDPVNCGGIEGKKDCLKSKECEWDTNEGTCVSKDGGLGVALTAESLSKEEAPVEVQNNMSIASNQLAVIGSVKLTGSDNGLCQEFELKKGCSANYNLQAKLYDDGSVVGKLSDVIFNTILLQADVDCMKFFFIDGDKYVVVGAVYTKGDKLDDILGLDPSIVGRRYVGVVKEDANGVVSNTGDFIINRTCDHVTEGFVLTRGYFENIDGQASIVFPSAPVNCGEVDGKKECIKSKECGWDTNEEICVSKDDGLGAGVVSAESFSKEEAPIQDLANGSNSADPKMIISGMVAGLFYALWL